HDGDSGRTRCSLVREGEYWTIEFDGTVCRLRHAKGLQHLARLLSAPDTSIAASELAARAGDASHPRAGRLPTAGEAEPARSAVTKTIKAAIRRLGTHDAALGFHLGATIKTGVVCIYTPDPGRRIRWVVEDRSTRT